MIVLLCPSVPLFYFRLPCCVFIFLRTYPAVPRLCWLETIQLSRTREPFKTSPESSSSLKWPTVQSENRSGEDNSLLIGDKSCSLSDPTWGDERRLPHRVSKLHCTVLIRVRERAISVTSSSADHVLRLRHTPDRIVARSFMSETHFP